MIWKKLGQVWRAEEHLTWGSMGTLTPTPFMIGNDVIRVFCGIRDENGVSRIGYFDVSEDNPNEVIGFCDKPVLDVGKPGMFDDNGMLLGDIIELDGELRMYYVGFQLGVHSKFSAYGGLAISKDRGLTFERYQQTPIIDRDEAGSVIRAIHGIKRLANGSFQAWYSEGNGWEVINEKPFPQYSVASISSENGVHFERDAGEPIQLSRTDEYRLGRSRVFSFGSDDHILTFTYGTTTGEYQSGYAHSTDLKTWKRKNDWGLYPGPDTFDSRHLAYPALIKNTKNKVFCFYNGNDMGAGGIGVAELESR